MYFARCIIDTKRNKIFKPDVVISMFLWSDFLTSLSLKFFLGKWNFNFSHFIHIAGDPAAGNTILYIVNKLRQKLYHKIVKFALKNCDKVITICNSDAKLINNHYRIQNSKIFIIPIGIEPPSKYIKLNLHKPFIFGVVSRLDKVKNINTIIESFYEVKRSFFNEIKLYIYGNGSEEILLRQLVLRLNIVDSVIFKGHINNPYLAFDSIDCLLLYSSIEGTPRSIIEAAVRGVPTISNDVGGINEMIIHNKTGYIVTNQSEFIFFMKHMIKNQSTVLNMGNYAADINFKFRSINNEIKLLNELIDIKEGSATPK